MAKTRKHRLVVGPMAGLMALFGGVIVRVRSSESNVGFQPKVDWLTNGIAHGRWNSAASRDSTHSNRDHLGRTGCRHAWRDSHGREGA